MSKEYEKELENTVEHLKKVIEEKNVTIDQQREMIDKFMRGEVNVNIQRTDISEAVNALYSSPSSIYNNISNNSPSDDSPSDEDIL